MNPSIAIFLGLALCLAVLMSGVRSEGEIERSLAEGRKLRAEAQKHFKKANDAQYNLYEAEYQKDVDAYENYLQTLRDENDKFLRAAGRYEDVREHLIDLLPR